MTSCSEHPGALATHSCDGCGRRLCGDCIVEGHRLLTCVHCRELAVPLGDAEPLSAPQYREQKARAAPYSFQEALAYVFRGRGIHVFGSYLAALAVLAFVGLFPIIGVAAGCLSMVFVAMVLFLVPSTLALIVRTTARGDNELPDWPDFSEYGERLSEIGGFLVTVLVAAVPLGLLVKLSGCEGIGSSGPHCLVFLCAGWFLALALWVPAFGALSVSQNILLAFRLDLHARVLTGFGRDIWITVVLSTALAVIGQIVALLMMAVPVFGLPASAAVGMYGWFTACHFIGLFFRRNVRPLADIYGAWR